MASIEQIVAASGDKLGGVFDKGILTSADILSMLQQGRVRLGEFNNALLIELDGQAYTLPDGFTLSPFRPS